MESRTTESAALAIGWSVKVAGKLGIYYSNVTGLDV